MLQNFKHSQDRKFVAVYGSGKCEIYPASELKPEVFRAQAQEFVWSSDGECAVMESASKIKLFSTSFKVCADLQKTFSYRTNLL